MSKLGKRLIKAAEEALAVARGEADPSTYRVHVPADIDVRKLLAEALARRRSRPRPSFRWTSRPMKSLVDLADKDTVYAVSDAGPP